MGIGAGGGAIGIGIGIGAGAMGIPSALPALIPLATSIGMAEVSGLRTDFIASSIKGWLDASMPEG
tara:strand:- start:307 stop:504 length:198 start_codon:yes stop_codon:yes gene_type:complete